MCHELSGEKVTCTRGGAKRSERRRSIEKSEKEPKKILSSPVRCFRSRQAFRCSLNFLFKQTKSYNKKPDSFFNFILCSIFDITIFVRKIILERCDYKTRCCTNHQNIQSFWRDEKRNAIAVNIQALHMNTSDRCV